MLNAALYVNHTILPCGQAKTIELKLSYLDIINVEIVGNTRDVALGNTATLRLHDVNDRNSLQAGLTEQKRAHGRGWVNHRPSTFVES